MRLLWHCWTARLHVRLLMPRVPVLLFLRSGQMDVPARQTYVAMVVDADERSAAGGITSIVRSIGLSLSPLLAGYLLADPNNQVLFSMPFILAGALKCIYDVLLWISFQTTTPVESGTAEYTQVGINPADVKQPEADTNLYDDAEAFDTQRK
jgi:MFS family permease